MYMCGLGSSWRWRWRERERDIYIYMHIYIVLCMHTNFTHLLLFTYLLICYFLIYKFRHTYTHTCTYIYIHYITLYYIITLRYIMAWAIYTYIHVYICKQFCINICCFNHPHVSWAWLRSPTGPGCLSSWRWTSHLDAVGGSTTTMVDM